MTHLPCFLTYSATQRVQARRTDVEAALDCISSFPFPFLLLPSFSPHRSHLLGQPWSRPSSLAAPWLPFDDPSPRSHLCRQQAAAAAAAAHASSNGTKPLQSTLQPSPAARRRQQQPPALVYESTLARRSRGSMTPHSWSSSSRPLPSTDNTTTHQKSSSAPSSTSSEWMSGSECSRPSMARPTKRGTTDVNLEKRLPWSKARNAQQAGMPGTDVLIPSHLTTHPY